MEVLLYYYFKRGVIIKLISLKLNDIAHMQVQPSARCYIHNFILNAGLDIAGGLQISIQLILV